MKILEYKTKDGAPVGITTEIGSKQKGKPKMQLKAELMDPDERKYWELPTRIEIDVRYVGENQPSLVTMIVGCMSAKHYGDVAVGVMDSYDADYGTVAFELFHERAQKYPVGNIAMFDFSGGDYPSDDIFEADFNLKSLINNIIDVCNMLMLDSRRKADYFVFYGNEEMWPPDAKWKVKLKADGCAVIECYEVNTFIAVRKLNNLR